MAEYSIVTHGSELVGVVTLDATESEVHTQDVEVAEFPVEAGVSVTDHVRPKPFELRINGTVSAASLEPALQAERRLEDAHAALLAASRAGEPVTVVTGLETYPGLVLRGYSVERSGRYGRALKISLDLVQVRIVDRVEVAIEALAPQTARPDGQPKHDAGAQTGRPPTGAEREAAASGLYQITHGGSVLGGVADAVGGLFL